MKIVNYILQTAILLFLCQPALAQEVQRTPVDHTPALKKKLTNKTPGSETVAISLPGSLAIDVTVEFESVTNLSLLNLGVTASVVNPVDIGLIARLPDAMVSIPEEFPVVVVIEPVSVGLNLLAFEGLATVTLLTSNLPYYPGTKLRLFKAHGGGDFEDITTEVSQGSYRVRGSGGDFSEFLIAFDGRENSEVVDTKFAALETTLVSYSGVIDSTVYSNLVSILADADLMWQKRAIAHSVVLIDSFLAAIVAATPAEVPDSWDTAGGPDNVAGILRSKAASLSFSLNTGNTKTRQN